MMHADVNKANSDYLLFAAVRMYIWFKNETELRRHNVNLLITSNVDEHIETLDKGRSYLIFRNVL